MRAQRIIQRRCPNGYLWLYYQFTREYARKPDDLEDMLDGLSCLRAKTEIEELYAKE
jgi:N6-adenosine-specific RNA methylase IME4